MRISSIPAYRVSRSMYNHAKIRHEQPLPQPNCGNETCFKGCNVFKIVGFVGGALACAVLAPGIAMAGLAGLGAVPGAFLGAELDKKIDHANGDTDSDGWNG